jgi:hypothetical protein
VARHHEASFHLAGYYGASRPGARVGRVVICRGTLRRDVKGRDTMGRVLIWRDTMGQTVMGQDTMGRVVMG